MKQFLENLAQKIDHKVHSLRGFVPLRAVYFGHLAQNGFSENYNFLDHIEHFEYYDQYGLCENYNMIIVYGAVNLNQKNVLIDAYEKIKGKEKYVIHIPGPKLFHKRPYFQLENISEIIPVDLVYDKFPLDLPVFLNEMKNMVEESRRA